MHAGGQSLPVGPDVYIDLFIHPCQRQQGAGIHRFMEGIDMFSFLVLVTKQFTRRKSNLNVISSCGP
jgi:hypothetical protein